MIASVSPFDRRDEAIIMERILLLRVGTGSNEGVMFKYGSRSPNGETAQTHELLSH